MLESQELAKMSQEFAKNVSCSAAETNPLGYVGYIGSLRYALMLAKAAAFKTVLARFPPKCLRRETCRGQRKHE
jgi:hypothetical protein